MGDWGGHECSGDERESGCAGGEQEESSHDVDAADAELVGEDATGADADEPSGLPDDVVEREDASAESVGCGGLEHGVVGDVAGAGSDPVEAEADERDREVRDGCQEQVDESAQDVGAEQQQRLADVGDVTLEHERADAGADTDRGEQEPEPSGVDVEMSFGEHDEHARWSRRRRVQRDPAPRRACRAGDCCG